MSSNRDLSIIPGNQLHSIHGGGFHGSYALLFFEILHAFMVAREFINYAVDRAQGAPIEEGDHFSRFFANLWGYSSNQDVST